MNNTLVCPQGGHSDRIDKVSYIYKTQTRTREMTEWVQETYRDEQGNYQSYSYPRSYDVVEITDLAKQLAPPKKPPAPSTKGLAWTILIGVPILGWLLLPVLFMFLDRLLGSSRFSDFSDMKIRDVLIWITCTCIPIAILGLAFFSYFRKKRRSQAMLPHWQRAITRWNQLYYCAQHDIIFNPYDEDGSAMSVSQMTRYLDS